MTDQVLICLQFSYIVDEIVDKTLNSVQFHAKLAMSFLLLLLYTILCIINHLLHIILKLVFVSLNILPKISNSCVKQFLHIFKYGNCSFVLKWTLKFIESG